MFPWAFARYAHTAHGGALGGYRYALSPLTWQRQPFGMVRSIVAIVST
jgi:hypothetical protein